MEKRTFLGLLINQIHMTNARLPSFKLLVGFEAAARLGNYSRAADELCVSQSAISHQIGQLERQVGQALFRRKGRGVELTVPGRLLHATVVKSLDVIRGGLGRIDNYLDDMLVTLVCPAHVAHGWLQPRVDALSAEHPDLCPIISIDETARYIDQLDVDIAITRQPLRQRGVIDEPLLEDALVTLAVPALAQRLSGIEAAHHPEHARLLCLEGDLTGNETGRFIREHLGSFRKAAIYDDPRLLLDAARRGRGLAVLSRLMADDDLSKGNLVPVAPYESLPGDTLWISRAEGELRSPLVQGVVESLQRMALA